MQTGPLSSHCCASDPRPLHRSDRKQQRCRLRGTQINTARLSIKTSVQFLCEGSVGGIWFHPFHGSKTSRPCRKRQASACAISISIGEIPTPKISPSLRSLAPRRLQNRAGTGPSPDPASEGSARALVKALGHAESRPWQGRGRTPPLHGCGVAVHTHDTDGTCARQMRVDCASVSVSVARRWAFRPLGAAQLLPSGPALHPPSTL